MKNIIVFETNKFIDTSDISILNRELIEIYNSNWILFDDLCSTLRMIEFDKSQVYSIIAHADVTEDLVPVVHFETRMVNSLVKLDVLDFVSQKLIEAGKNEYVQFLEANRFV